VLSALGSYLLRSRQVEFLLQVRASASEPMRSETILSRTVEEVISCAGVRYGPAAPLGAIREALDRRLPFAFIGKPCDVVGLRLLGRLDPRVGQYCKFALSLQCGGGPEFIKSRDLVRNLGLREEEVSLLRYRGFGNPGRTRIETHDGRAFELTYQEMWDDQSKWCSHSRCRICPDGIGESADVVVGDHWPGCEPSGEDAGFNSVMIRTSKGLQLMAAAAEAGDVRIAREIGLDEMSLHQPHQVTKKEEVWGRLAGLRAAKHLVPDVEGLRLREIASGQPRSKSMAAAKGARRRLRQGRFTEPPVREECK
jgi:coenzyme F420 hydrogenase subunit beta